MALFVSHRQETKYVIFEVFTAVTMKNGVFWDVTPCGSCKSQIHFRLNAFSSPEMNFPTNFCNATDRFTADVVGTASLV
jgi:hypothetical protein